MAGIKIVQGVVATNSSFRRAFERLKGEPLKKEVKASLRSLFLLDLDLAPTKLHLHMLTNKLVSSALDPSKKVKAWTFHVTADDRYKASFTFENGIVYLRLVDEHDRIDDCP